MAFFHVETKWPCISPFGQRLCEGSLVVINDGDTYSVACDKCHLGIVGKGQIPEFWITKLIQQGYLQQLSRVPTEKKILSDFVLTFHRNRWTPQEIVDEFLARFEIFHRGGE